MRFVLLSAVLFALPVSAQVRTIYYDQWGRVVRVVEHQPQFLIPMPPAAGQSPKCGTCGDRCPCGADCACDDVARARAQAMAGTPTAPPPPVIAIAPYTPPVIPPAVVIPQPVYIPTPPTYRQPMPRYAPPLFDAGLRLGPVQGGVCIPGGR
jgi:hypothetical protein